MGWFSARKHRTSSSPSSLRRGSANRKQPARKNPSRVGSFERLEEREVFSVTFHGGALLPHVEAQPVFLGSDWQANSSLNSQATSLNQYVNYLVQSPYMDTLGNAGYNVGEGSAAAGVELNLSLNKTTGITDAQIQADLQAGINSSQLAAPDANRLYVVYVEPSVKISLGSDTSVNSFLGYHGAFAGKTASGTAIDIHYAVMAYPGSPNPSYTSQGFASSFDQLTSVSSHEIAEAVTDPNVNYKALGWYDDTNNGEIGDLTNVQTTLNGYLVQEVVNKNDQPMAIVSGTTTGGTLSAPQNVTATAASTTSAKLTWSSVSGATGYRILQVNGTQTTVIGTVGSTATSTTVTGLTAGTTYSFKVEAYNSAATADSAAVSVTLPTSSASLGTPQNVAISALSSTSAKLSWTGVSGASGYRIFELHGTQKTSLGTVSSATTAVNITGLAPGSTDSFLVEAYNSTAVADSTVVTVTLPGALAAPQVTAVATSSTTAVLSWNAVNGAQGYRVYMWNGYQAVLLGTFNSATTSVQVTNLTPGTTAQFVVEAYNGTAVTDSNWISVTLPLFYASSGNMKLRR